MPAIVRVTREMAESRLGNVPPAKEFYVHDGTALRKLEDLSAALDRMSDDTFSYHSGSNKSDFRNWVRDVIGDDKLAKDLEKAPNRSQAARAVASRVEWLKSKLK